MKAVLAGEQFVSSGLELNITELDEIRLRYAAIVDSSDDAIIAKDLQGVISAWNPAAQRMFGYTQEEALGQPITIVVPPELHARVHDTLRRLRAGERIEHFETRRVSKTGKTIDISLTISPIKDAGGRVVGVPQSRATSQKARRY
jgi:PAS domain S-box-containing protein